MFIVNVICDLLFLNSATLNFLIFKLLRSVFITINGFTK